MATLTVHLTDGTPSMEMGLPLSFDEALAAAETVRIAQNDPAGRDSAVPFEAADGRVAVPLACITGIEVRA